MAYAFNKISESLKTTDLNMLKEVDCFECLALFLLERMARRDIHPLVIVKRCSVFLHFLCQCRKKILHQNTTKSWAVANYHPIRLH